MKKVISAALCLVMALSLGTGALADLSNSTGSSTPRTVTSDGRQTTSVSFTVAPTYTVTIPASITLGYTPPTTDTTVGAFSGTGEVKSSETLILESGKSVFVKIAADSADFKVALSGDSAVTVDYKIEMDGSALAKGATVAEFNYGNRGDAHAVTLTYTNTGEIKYAGEYSGTMNFTIAVDDSTGSGS